MEQADSNAGTSADEGLNELLDSCLNDFNKPLPKTTPSTAENKKSDVSEVKTTTVPQMANSAAWSEEFKQFSEVMENFLENESDFEELKNLMGNLNQNGELDSDENFAESFAETIRGLTEGAQNIPEPTPEEIGNLFSGLGLGDINQSDPDQASELMPLMQNIMQKLMSKELLYPSLKEIVDKYPQWLADKRSTLKEQEYELYSRQYSLMKNVCEEFEKQCDDSEEAKKRRFEKILQLMHKIQNCGNPPKELVSESGQALPFDEHGNIQVPGMPQQCAIM